MAETKSLTLRHYRTGEGLRIDWQDGKIAAIEPAVYSGDKWLAPGLTDLQVNGYAKYSYGSASLTREQMLSSVRAMNRDGAVQYFPTLCTNVWSKITARLRQMRSWCDEELEIGAAVAGWHIEGPFMSPVPGYVGAHSKELMISPTEAHIRELSDAAGGLPVLLTMAPEQPGVIESISAAVEAGICVSLGHTNASAEQIAAAIKAGATSFTHLGNGIPQEIDRHDNIVWRVLDTAELQIGLIPDSIHVSPTLFRILHRAVDPSRFWYTTDAVHPAGALPGVFPDGDGKLVVGEDQVVRMPGATNFAGSALRPLEGVFRAADMLRVSWREVWDRFAIQPRAMVGLDTEPLSLGKTASFCVLDFSEASNPTVSTYIGGGRVSTLPAKGWMSCAGIEE